MTENKRYSDGSLAKWYYSRDYNGMRAISNGVSEFTLNMKGTNQLLDELNNLEDKILVLEKENKGLKQENRHLKNKLKFFNELNKPYGAIIKENEQLKQRIKSRLHYYRELCNDFDEDDGFTYNIVERVVEDLEDILK